MTHETVLLNEAVEGLNLQAGGNYIDGTFGRGGHSKKILEGLGSDATLLVVDKDPAAIEVAEILKKEDERVQIMHGSFSDIKSLVKKVGLLGKIDGVLLDLGLSSPQLDESERGFSLMRKGPLDMRMKNESELSAKDRL